MHVVYALGMALALSLVPAQTRHSSRVALSVGDACEGLSAAECCAQRLKLAGFRALGEHLPPKARTTVSLSCGNAERVVPPGACRTIASSRGFSAHDVSTICPASSKVKRKCGKDGECRRCTAELKKLNYRKSHNACYPVTYVPAHTGARRVVVLRTEGEPADGDTRFEVVRRRTVVR